MRASHHPHASRAVVKQGHTKLDRSRAPMALPWQAVGGQEKLSNQEGGGDDDDRVGAPNLLLLRVYRHSGATAVRFWGAGKTFFAPRPPSSA